MLAAIDPATFARSSSLSFLKAAENQAVNEAVAGVASHAMAGTGVARPASRGEATRRRPAPKVITDGALQLGTKSPLSPKSPASVKSRVEGLAGEFSSPVAADLRTTLLVDSGDVRSDKGATDAQGLMCLAQCSPDPRCTVSAETDIGQIRTKVFRMGAPLLRSTIPVALGARRASASSAASTEGQASPIYMPKDRAACDNEGSDVETILSVSDLDMEDQGTLSVTLDFPC